MKQKQFPAQTGFYAVKVKSEQSTHCWQDFNTARLQISVGQPYHEDHKQQAIMDWARHRFEKVMVCINDSLQRYNAVFEENLTQDQALEHTLAKGKDWIARNDGTLQGDNVDLVRWDHWLETDDYKSTKLKIDWLYAGNPAFKQAIDNNIMTIWNRRKDHKPDLYTEENFSRFFKLSREYLLEEIAGFSVMFEKERGIDVYPGTAIFAATIFQGKEVIGAPPGLGKGHFCRVDFKRNKPPVSMDYLDRPNPLALG